MPRLLSLIGRSALVALGLAAAAPVHAASVTIDAGAACTAFSWNQANSTLTCQVSLDCVVTGPSTATPGSPITLNASCPTATTITWSGSSAVSGCSGNTCQVTETSEGSRTYVATPNTAGAPGSKVVNWTTAQTAPSGCSLTASPTSGSAATNVVLTASCTAGTSPITVAWGGSGTGSCPTSFNVGSPAQCTINGVAATTTWTASFSNGGGQATSPANPRSATFTYNAGGGGGNFAGCPANTLTVDNAWGVTLIDTIEYGGFTDNELSVRFVPTSGSTSEKTSAWVEFGASATLREYALSTSPCDYSANVLSNGLGQKIKGVGVTGPSMKYRLGTPTTFAAGLTPGVAYYINIRNRNSAGGMTCTQADCRMRGGVPK